MDSIAAHVKLIDDGRLPGVAEGLVALPVEIRVGDDALGRGGRVIDLGQGQVFLGRGRIIAESRAKVAAREWRDRGRVGVHHKLIRIEAVPFAGSVRSGDAKPVELARLDPLQPHVPDIAGLVPGRVEDDAPGRHGILGVVEEVEADASGVPAEDREVDAIAPQVRPKGKGHARADGLDFAQAQQPLQLGQLLRARGARAGNSELAWILHVGRRQRIVVARVFSASMLLAWLEATPAFLFGGQYSSLAS